jgi:hypothetical protein
MAVTLKEEQSEAVRQQHRNAAGAWITGQEYKEQGSATQPQANSDHGNFQGGAKGIDKNNA